MKTSFKRLIACKLQNKLVPLLVIFLSAILIIFSGSPNIVKAGSPRDTSSEDLISVKFELKDAVDLDQLLVIEKKYKFKQIILEGNFVYKGGSIHDFYALDNSNGDKNIKEDYSKSRKALIVDIEKNNQSLQPSDLQSLENILISDVKLIGSKSNTDQMKKDLDANNIRVLNLNVKDVGNLQPKEKVIPKEAFSPKKEAGAVAALATVADTMIPKSGTSYFYPSSAGGRYVQQNMKWTSVSFSSDQTYEHDVFLYNYDRKTYLNGANTAYPNCYPTTTYAATTWPSASKPYLDTRLSENLVSCEIDELAYTIGAAQANALQANTDYYTYIRTADGNDTVDKFKLQAQIGHRIPTSCYTTWCSFRNQSYTLIPGWSSSVPGTQSWTYGETVPNAPSNVSVTDPTSSSLKMNFTDNASNETNILIERKTGTGGTWTSVGGFGVLSGTGNWYWVNTSLSSNTTYCYRLKAINNVGSSPYSNEACGTTTSNSSARSEVVTDDTSSGFTKGGSYWQEANIGYNSHMFWTYVNGGVVNSWGEWQANLAGGNYEVYAFIPSNYATTASAKYTIYYNGSSTVRSLNQNSYYNAWVSLGTYSFTSGTARRVRLTDATGETNYNLRVGFDAIKFTPR